MADHTVNLLFLGDIVGESGVFTVMHMLPQLKEQHQVDFTVANAENAHQGRGLNEVLVGRLYKGGVDVITGGDHSFDKHLIFGYMNQDRNLLRPMNYPKGAPGYGFGVYPAGDQGALVGVVNLRGNTFFQNTVRNPFDTAEFVLRELANHTKLVFVDFHAEATAEKRSMGWFLDGRVSALAGTHTHVQTNDAEVLPQGTGYLTDVGFCGPYHSVIGMEAQVAIKRYRTALPQKYELAKGNLRVHGVLFKLDIESGKCLQVTPIQAKCPLDEEELLQRYHPDHQAQSTE